MNLRRIPYLKMEYFDEIRDIEPHSCFKRLKVNHYATFDEERTPSKIYENGKKSTKVTRIRPALTPHASAPRIARGSLPGPPGSKISATLSIEWLLNGHTIQNYVKQLQNELKWFLKKYWDRWS